MKSIVKAAAAAVLTTLAFGLAAQEAAIRKNLAERLPNFPKIDEVSKTPLPGLYEVRVGNDIVYSDAEGNFLIRGELIDTKSKRNLTAERVDKLSVISFSELALNDAIVMKQGNGKRKLAVFSDPNCPYCKRFERELQSLKNVTVYTFLYPILSADSTEKSRNVWCAKDRLKVWQDWMLNGTPPPAVAGKCDTPIERNLELGRRYNLSGTPTLVFEDGTRVPGAISAQQVEERLAAAAK